MRTWREMDQFYGIDLEDSWVMSWQFTEDTFVIRIEVSLWPGHAHYEEPLPGAYTCYKPGRLVFPHVTSIAGLRSMDEVKGCRNPDGSVDFGTISLWQLSDSQYVVDADFGRIEMVSKEPFVEIISNIQCGKTP